ncbi:queuine tRNA-ribosyltransferase accessory subunit 2 [Anthonomus grandis grandis]|uniref:queuine tRNA-ribosyltransferase accessory subunit 2 n=1 Tax=Anthonomus grandis grandis TaxID=2921223 RepID=UPI002166772B|nr:queuine tRNA-ribosyltransferase accessory subunit 2 [Anthonomus grandis grandis]
MKFTVKTVLQRSPRLGELSQIPGKPDIKLETPLVLLHTQAGHVPHITHEVLKMVTQEPQILQIPVVSMHKYQEAIKSFSHPVADFIGSKNSLTCLTLHDVSDIMKPGHHIKEKVPVFTRNGKVLYDSDKYMDMVEHCQPNMYVLLSDSDTNETSAPKRIAKALDNTVAFVKQCLERHKKCEALKDSLVIAPIAGAYCVKSRQKCLNLLKPYEESFHGYLIDGLHNNGPQVEFIPFKDIKPIVDTIVEAMPEEKLLAIQGCWNPVNIIKLVKAGVDLFDTSYCRILTERSSVMIFAIDPQDTCNIYELNLREEQFSEDLEPLKPNCECLVCMNYTRAYIHHLLTVQELLGPILIMIHNTHHMLKFFNKIRESIKDGTLDELEWRVQKQFDDFQSKFEQKVRSATV